MSKSALRVTLGLILVAVVFASAPAWAGRADLRLYGEFMSYLALAVLWNMLAGYAGLMSVGQQAFVGLVCCRGSKEGGNCRGATPFQYSERYKNLFGEVRLLCTHCPHCRLISVCD